MNSLKPELNELKQIAPGFKLNIESHHLELFNIFIDELIEWNSRTNLIGPLNRKQIVIELILDSLVPAPHLPINSHIFDFGSGGGFPGIPIKIYLEDLPVTLIDRSSKKTSFLKYIVRRLKLKDIHVINTRIEEGKWCTSDKGSQVITAKALAPLQKTIKLCSPYLADNGILIYYGGQIQRENSIKIEHLLNEYNLQLQRRIEYQLPGLKGKRNILMFMKQ